MTTNEKTNTHQMLLAYSRKNPALSVEVEGILTFSYEDAARKFSGFVGGMVDFDGRYHYVAINNQDGVWVMNAMSMRGKMNGEVTLKKPALTKKQMENQNIQREIVAKTVQEIKEDDTLTVEQMQQEIAEQNGNLTTTLQVMNAKLPKLKGCYEGNEISLWLRQTQNGYMLAGNMRLEVSDYTTTL